MAAAQETAETLIESLQKGQKGSGGGSDQFFQTSATNFLAACIYFFVNYGKNHTTSMVMSLKHNMKKTQTRIISDSLDVYLQKVILVRRNTLLNLLIGKANIRICLMYCRS